MCNFAMSLISIQLATAVVSSNLQTYTRDHDALEHEL